MNSQLAWKTPLQLVGGPGDSSLDTRLGGPGRFKSAMMVGDPDLGAEFLSDKILV